MNLSTTYNAATGEYGTTVAEEAPTIDVSVPDQLPTPEERIAKLEQDKADQADVKELAEALEMILSGVTE